jgi:ribonucleotide reductase alpha subunit
MRFMPAGRIQSAMGSPKNVTAYNCFVSGTIEDSMESIMERATQAAETMRRGGGIGYDFSRIRPAGDRIVSLDSNASGPVSFMHIFDAVCQTIVSAGHRRGAMMGVLRVDHPDIEEFIRAKQNDNSLTNFNISVGVTDEFMDCVVNQKDFKLQFNGQTYKHIDASALWDEIMRANWDWAEPGVLFIDRINEDNPLGYCETIEATNPCGEQPLPPFGACLLGSFNLIKYTHIARVGSNIKYVFDYDQLTRDVPIIVRAMDNVIDRTQYPLAEQKKEAQAKRRMRNSHLMSIAPTGTISFCADNISSGLEPVFAHELDRTVITEEGPTIVKLKDYVWNNYDKKCETTDGLTVDQHLDMQITAQPFIDSAISKTINVGDQVTFEEFKKIYTNAWKGKLKGVTTFRLAGKRYGILNKVDAPTKDEQGAACFYDPETGKKECDL